MRNISLLWNISWNREMEELWNKILLNWRLCPSRRRREVGGGDGVVTVVVLLNGDLTTFE